MRLSHDRWYSRDGQRRLQGRAYSQSSALRKVVALSLLLAMVVVVMVQLSDPAKFTPAFSVIGLTQTAQPLKPAEAPAAEPHPVASSVFPRKFDLKAASIEVDQARQIWNKLLSRAAPEAVNELAVAEFVAAEKDDSRPNDEPAKPFLDWLDQTDAVIEEWSSVSKRPGLPSDSPTDAMEAFISQWKAWSSLHRRGIQSASSALDDDVRAGLKLAIDQHLLGLIKDAEPWRPIERWALSRTLQRAGELRTFLQDNQALLGPRPRLQIGTTVEVQLLIKQTRELRGKVIRFRASPATTPEASKVNAVGFPSDDYDVVWMKPEGSNPQPICVYHRRDAAPRGGWPTIRRPDEPADPKSRSMLADEVPMVEVTGILMKRLAYPSQRGIDVAPVLVAFDSQWVAELNASQLTSMPIENDVAEFPRWMEPGERENELNILREILASNLEALRDDAIIAALLGPIEAKPTATTDDSKATDDASPFRQLAQSLNRLPRLEPSLRRLYAGEADIGPARLGTLRGWVERIEPIVLPSTRDEEGRPLTIHRLQVRAVSGAETQPPTIAFVNRVPNEWEKSKEIRQPIELKGLKLVFEDGTTSKSFWIADHPPWSWAWLASWKSSDVDASTSLVPNIDPSWTQLGSVGFDLSHAELLHQLNKQPLTTTESEAFYSLMAAADRSGTASATSSTGSTATPAVQDAFDCLDGTFKRTLRTTRAKVHVVRVTRIEVSSEAAQDALKASFYYELDGLVDIRGHAVRLKSADGKVKVDFEAEYPITLVAKQIPSWLFSADSTKPPASDKPIDDSVWYPRKTIEVDGYFYRLWSYTTSQTRNAAQQASNSASRFLQNGPLIAVTSWKAYEETPVTNGSRSIVREVFIGLGLTAICLYIAYRFQSNARKKKRRKAA